MSYIVKNGKRYYVDEKTGKVTLDNVSEKEAEQRERKSQKGDIDIWKLCCVILLVILALYVNRGDAEHYESDRIEEEIYIPPVEEQPDRIEEEIYIPPVEEQPDRIEEEIYIPPVEEQPDILQEEVEERTSVSIRELYSIRGDYSEVFTPASGVRDNFGNTYENAQVAYAVEQELTYNLDGTYNYLRGTIALSEAYKDDILSFYVEVYDGNNEKIYESPRITDDYPDPIEVNCNISGLSRMTIRLVGRSIHWVTGVDVIMPMEGFVLSKE